MYLAKDIERLWQISRKTVYKMAQNGELTVVPIGRSRRFPKQAIHDWIKERTYRPRPVNRNGKKKGN